MSGFRMPDQRATTEQIADLVPIAREHGLGDAAEFLCRVADVSSPPPTRPTDPDLLRALFTLVGPANRAGLYDAADYLLTVTGHR